MTRLIYELILNPLKGVFVNDPIELDVIKDIDLQPQLKLQDKYYGVEYNGQINDAQLLKRDIFAVSMDLRNGFNAAKEKLSYAGGK